MKLHHSLVYLFTVCLLLQRVNSMRAENVSVLFSNMYIRYLEHCLAQNDSQ